MRIYFNSPSAAYGCILPPSHNAILFAVAPMYDAFPEYKDIIAQIQAVK